MSEEKPQFPDYGDNGDTAGVRRARRSFRLVVVAAVVVTLSLWTSERFLQYDDAERNFITSLTHERSSARVFLLQAIKTDAALRDKPTPKYHQALAVRSEHDVILDLMQTGVELDPTNALFRLRYGSKLFNKGRASAAAEQFQSAAELPQRNALPLYLEAAAIARADTANAGALSEALTKVAMANSMDAALVFPRPVWSQEYPAEGIWYARLSREIQDEICAPLYVLSELVTDDVSRQIAQNRLQNAETWLDEILEMGERLVMRSEPLSTTAAIAGLTIQLQALDVLESLGPPMNGMSNEELIEKRLRVSQALELLQGFESAREALLQEELEKYQRPMAMVLTAMAVFVGVHVLGLTVHRLFRFKKSRWTVPHSTIGKVVLTAGTVLLFIMLALIRILQGSPEDGTLQGIRIVSVLWYMVIAGMVGFGVLYPAATLKRPQEVSRRSSRLEDMEQTIRLARQSYRRAYASLALRYYGILSGVTTCLICAWVILFRIVVGLYPWQYKLLASGLLDEERSIVRDAIDLLREVSGYG